MNEKNVDKVENFITYLRNYHTNVNAFIKLFNLWSQMTPDERGEVIERDLKW